jgi:hypothetical protein
MRQAMCFAGIPIHKKAQIAAVARRQVHVQVCKDKAAFLPTRCCLKPLPKVSQICIRRRSCTLHTRAQQELILNTCLFLIYQSQLMPLNTQTPLWRQSTTQRRRERSILLINLPKLEKALPWL